MDLDYKKLSLVASLVALNLIIGAIISFLKIPVYLDTIGIMLTTLLLGWRYGVLNAILTAIISFVVISPYVPFFVGNMLGVVLITHIARNYNYYSTFPKTIITGIVHGIVATILAAPVTYLLFGGFTATGNDFFTAYFNSIGIELVWSVVFAVTITNCIDRILVCIFSVSVLRAVPKSFYNKNELKYYKD